MSLRAKAAALILLASSALSCDSTAPVVLIEITPGDVELFVGAVQQFSARGVSGATWSSSNAQVAIVVPQTGFVEAVGRGSAQITATSGNTSESVTVTVLAPKSLSLSNSVINFQALVGGANPQAQTVVVSNAGDGPISNITVGTIAYGSGEPTGWLNVTPSGSTAPVTLTLNATRGSLARGTYTAIVPVRAEGIDNSPQNIAVTFVVQQPASIELSRNTVPVTRIPGQTVIEEVDITNGGDVPLTGLSRTIVFSGAPGQSWLTAAFTGTTAPSTLNLTVNTTGLAPGNYSATVTVSSAVAGVASKDIAVQLTVIPGPSIQLSTQTVNLNATFGINPQTQQVVITNGGGGTLNGLSVGTIVYGAGASNWITTSFVGGVTTATTTLNLNINSAALAVGVYTATVPVQSAVASNSPRNITVTLTVGAAQTMLLSRTTVPISGIPGIVFAGETVNITSSGAAIAGLARTIAYTAGQPQNWITSATFNSATTPSTLTIVANSTELLPGVYTATINITSTTPGVGSRDVTVQLTVTQGPSIVLGTNPVNVSVPFGTNPANIPVQITNGGGGTLNNLTLGNPVYTQGTAGWLSRSLNVTTAPATITLTIASSGLVAGSYRATIAVQSSVASNSPVSLVVNLTVQDAPVISLNPNFVSFAAWGNQTTLPGSQPVQITNTGGSPLNGLSVSISAGATSWLTASLGGSQAPTTLSIRPSTTNLSAGTYTGTVTISSSSPGTVSKGVTVTYVVQTFSQSLHSFFANAGCGSCHVLGPPPNPPVYSATPSTYYASLVPAAPNQQKYIIPGNPSSSLLVCKIFGSCTHVGQKFNLPPGAGVPASRSQPNFQSTVTSWINAGAPYR